MNNPRVYVSGYHDMVSCFALDRAVGALTLRSSSAAGPKPAYLAWHPSREFLYAANEVSPGRISAYAIDAQDGRLTRLNDESSAGDGPCHLSVHSGGRWVFAANYGSGTVGVLPVRPDGGVDEPLPPVVPGRNAHQILCDASGAHVFVPCLGSDWIAQYRFDAATGTLTPNTPATVRTAAGAGPRHLAFHPSGRLACLINERGNTLTSLSYDAALGRLTPIETHSTLPDDCTVKSATAHVLFDPSGRFVYGSNRGHDSLVIFAIDAATGRLRLIGHEQGGGGMACPRDFAIDDDGQFLLAASQQDNRVTVFRREAGTGALLRVSTTRVPPGPAFIGMQKGSGRAT